MPHNDRRRERRNTRDPESDNDLQRRQRRPSDSHRRRRGHRATDSTGELLPKNRDRSAGHYDSSANSTPRRSKQSASLSVDSAGNPLSLGSLAQLDALNAKKDRKNGINTYDEAYLQEVRAKEIRLEKERKSVEREERRRQREEDEARQTEAEEERLRKEDRRRRREQRLRREEADEHIRTPETPIKKERRKSRNREEIVVVESYDSEGVRRNPARLHDEWKRNHRKYEKIVEPKPHQDRKSRHSKQKQRVISGPYVEDARAEKVYRYEKSTKSSRFKIDFTRYKKWICKYMSNLCYI
jgi:glucan 1,3-beta-glucosidase